ncbi:hypothetical protein D3C76_209660 [compost metagenome]
MLFLASIDRVPQFVNLGGERKKNQSLIERDASACHVSMRDYPRAEPELLFLDEPTSALDPVNSAHIYKGLRY